ncbi:MAG: hypothetical protein ACOYJQ_05375 [Pseudochelatococcus sp.]|jgi:hypothetical protein|uniref:hypothetical protein n=1 Tax=Pseudochelatococcus sp. TaxID=2020869 RepID=UPI003D8B3955
MTHAIIRDGAPVELHPGKPFADSAGVQHPAGVLRLWSAAELAAIGVCPIVETPVPAGHRATGSALHRDAQTGAVTRVYETEPLPPADLAALKAALKAGIDAQAEAGRQRYITPGAGQALTYQAKAAEAARHIESGGAGDYPLLAAEIGITGATLAEVADVVHAAYQQWLAIGAQIEAARLAAKAAVEAASDETSARAVTAAWPQA